MELENKIINEPYLGKRIFAGFFDYLIIFIFLGINFYFFGEKNKEGETTLNGLPALSVMVFWFISTVLTENFLGATIGNKIVGLKPISLYNNKLTLSQSFKRHLLDMVDMTMFGLIGILTIKNTNKNQRLGDLWAKTTVVQNSDLTY